jgi:type 1 glutamine amidotransferase
MSKKLVALLTLVFLATISVQAESPLRVFIRAGVKTHGPGEHDHPRFLKEWIRLLNDRGTKADGSLEFPSSTQLAKTDVLVFYAANAGDIGPAQRLDLEAYLKRGGGLVVIHDAVCGHDPDWFKGIIGGAWEHGHSKWLEGEMGVYYTQEEHPITSGARNFFLDDEIYYELHMMPGARVLAESFHSAFVIAPQMWVYEKNAYRAFVSIPGHKYTSFSLPHYRAILLRGIAWAGHREVDSLATQEELGSLNYPEGGPPAPEKAHETLKVHSGFDVSLTVAEPLVQNPIAITAELAKPNRARAAKKNQARAENKKAQLAESARAFTWGNGPRVLIVGGGQSHDFDRWFNRADVATLGGAGLSVHYTDRAIDIASALKQIDVLLLTNNKPIPDVKTREAVFEFARRGGGLVLVHPALWYNWKDWPEYNRVLVSGGSRGHDKYGSFRVELTRGDHPVTAGVPQVFAIRDELYHHKIDPQGAGVEVLARAKSPHSGKTFPIVWTVKHPKARIACITLGHDEASHSLPAFKALLINAARWASNK